MKHLKKMDSLDADFHEHLNFLSSGDDHFFDYNRWKQVMIFDQIVAFQKNKVAFLWKIYTSEWLRNQNFY